MAVTKIIEVDGKEVQFRASAAIPRLYRNKFHRDKCIRIYGILKREKQFDDIG